MFSSEGQSDVMWLVSGIVILVLGGVFLSLIVDGNLRFSRKQKALMETIQSNETAIENLSLRKKSLSDELQARELSQRKNGRMLQAATTEQKELSERKKILDQSRAAIIPQIEKLESEFPAYRRQYKETYWRQAVGKTLDSIRLAGGKTYQQVTITQVTDTGLEIRHESGTARLSARDLDVALREKFQWDLDPAMVSAAPASNRTKSSSKSYTTHPEATIRPSPTYPQSEPENLEPLRLNVRLWAGKVATLREKKSHALAQSSYGANKSVPGSLQTWQQRGQSLDIELQNAEKSLARARASLASVSPNDPLLLNTWP